MFPFPFHPFGVTLNANGIPTPIASMPPPMFNEQGEPVPFVPPQDPVDVRNLIINFIPSEVDANDLRLIFQKYGEVESAKIVCDRDTGHSKGYGFIVYRQGYMAIDAIMSLNGYVLGHRQIKVGYANPVAGRHKSTRNKPQQEQGRMLS